MLMLKDYQDKIISILSPDTLLGAFAYLLVFVFFAFILSRSLSLLMRGALSRSEYIDRTTANFLQQLAIALIWVVALILYAHLIPALRAMGTALLAGASVVSIVLGLAAQSTLGNLVAGLAITLYRPFRLGDTLQVMALNSTQIGEVKAITLGYTTLLTEDGRLVMIPNSVAASQICINLNASSSPFPLKIKIAVDRSVNIEAACQQAVKLAIEVLGQQAVGGCILKRIDEVRAELELSFQISDKSNISAVRSKLLTRLVSGFSGDPAWGAPPGPTFI